MIRTQSKRNARGRKVTAANVRASLKYQWLLSNPDATPRAIKEAMERIDKEVMGK